jgi:sugar phosphate isomerase/epimerase
MTLDIGLQIFSVKNAFASNPRQTLDRIAQIGYRHIEMPIDLSGKDLFGMGEITAVDLKRMTDQAGLNIFATHVLLEGDEQVQSVIEYNENLGSKDVIIPIAFFQDEEDVLRFSEKLNQYGELLYQHGMKLHYHNHFHEFQRFNDKYVLDIILENTAPELVGIELDMYWAQRGGVNPTEYLAKIGKRCRFIHQKDLPASISTINIFEEIENTSEITIQAFQSYGKPEYFTEIGEGIMKIETIIQTARKIEEMHYIIVEQDATLKDELESIETSFRNLSVLLEK